MSSSREILMDLREPIKCVVDSLNAILVLSTPMIVKTMGSPAYTWQIGVGMQGVYPVYLTDTTGIDPQTSLGYPWCLAIECRHVPGELVSEGAENCDRLARAMMIRIGSALRVRCVLLSNLQRAIGEYP